MHETALPFDKLAISRDRDQFLRELLRELTGVLEDAVGSEEAEGFIALVGGRLGNTLNREYCEALGEPRLDSAQIANALVDLKQRINGGFSVESLEADSIVLTNTACPFGDYVKDRPSLCMMTSNVFGRITASNLEYCSVEIDKAIAMGDTHCRIVIHLAPDNPGRQYYA